MFVLEKILRSLSEGDLNLNEKKNNNLNDSQSIHSGFSSSISYFEFLNSFDELRKDFKVIISDSEYYDRIRLLFRDPLKGATERLQNINDFAHNYRFIDDLKILLLAHDNKMKIYNLNLICWSGILIKLANELELDGRRCVLLRILRFLRVSNLDLNVLPLILLNSIKKTIKSNSGLQKISFCLQIIKDYFNNDECRCDQGLLEGLLGILRSKEICGKTKGMVVKVLREVWGLDSDLLNIKDFKDIVRDYNNKSSSSSAVLTAAFIQNFPDMKFELSNKSRVSTSEFLKSTETPKSSSKFVNFLNGIFEDATEIEREILCQNELDLDDLLNDSSNYEKLLITRYITIDEK